MRYLINKIRNIVRRIKKKSSDRLLEFEIDELRKFIDDETASKMRSIRNAKIDVFKIVNALADSSGMTTIEQTGSNGRVYNLRLYDEFDEFISMENSKIVF